MTTATRPLEQTPVALARAYFAVQAVAGAAWWVAVFASDEVERWTLGEWDPGLLVGPDLVLFVGASALAALLGSRVFAAIAAAWTTAMTVALLAYGLVEHQAGWGAVVMILATVGTWASTSVLWTGQLPLHLFFIGPFAFREAGEASGGRHLRRSLAQLIVFWTTFFVLIPLVVAAVEEQLRITWPALDHQGWKVVATAAFLGASVLGLWSCVTMALIGEGTPLPAETARKLVVAGPYRCVRNPMAVAGAIQTASIGLLFGSWIVVVMAVAGAVAWNVLIRPAEEADLAARFGESYERYARHVRCWVPTKPWPGRTSDGG